MTTSTYQADQNEKNKCYFSEDRPARYVAVACERKGCAFMQIKQPSTYLLWTLWPWENRHSPSMQDHAPRPLGNNWQNREGRRYFQATNKNKGDEKGLSQWMVNWSMLMLICWIYIIYILATKKHTCIIAWSTKFFTKTMHFLYHSYCYAVLSGPCCCWCLDNHYLFPSLYRVAWEKGCGCGERWIILQKKGK